MKILFLMFYSNAPRIPPGRDTAACFSPAGNKSYCKVSYIQHALMAASVGSVSRATAASSLPVTQVESSTQNGYQFASETFRIRLAQKTLKQQRRSARKPIPPKQKNLQKSSKNRARVTQSEGRMHQKCSQNWDKCGESPKVATRWLPRPLYREGLVDFLQFWGPSWSPKNY